MPFMTKGEPLTGGSAFQICSGLASGGIACTLASHCAMVPRDAHPELTAVSKMVTNKFLMFFII
jgi:hypothetical protein